MLVFPSGRKMMSECVNFFSLDRDKSECLRGFSILMIMLAHLQYILWEGQAGLFLFLILSGYGLTLSTRKNGLDFYWRKKIKKIWLPYFGVSLLQILIGNAHGLKAIVFTIIGLDFKLIADRTMWFISFIFANYFAFWVAVLLTKRVKNERIRQGTIMILLLLAAYLLRRLFYTAHVWNYASAVARYVLAFPTGVFLGIIGNCRLAKTVKNSFWSAILFFSLVFIIPHFGKTFDIRIGAAITLFVLALTQLFTFKKRVWKRFLMWVGKYSYPIYLFEGLFLEYKQSWFGALESRLLIDLAYFAVTFGIAAIYWKTFIQLLPKRDTEKNR